MILQRSDIAAIGERLLEEIITHPPEEAWRFGVRTSSGTTDKPLVGVQHYGIELYSRYAASTNILICYGSLNIRLSHALFVAKSTSPGVQRTMFADVEDFSADYPSLIAQFAPDTIAGFPAFVARVAEMLDKKTGDRVKSLQFAGERVTPALATLFAHRFPNAKIRMIYVANEIGGISTGGCGYLPVNFYHPREGVTVEIENTDETGAGDLIVSKWLDDKTYIEKYRIGDTARFSDMRCPCGASVTFEHLGRKGYDYVKIAGATARREEFDRVAALFPQYIDDYRAEVGEKLVDGKLKGSVVLRVFSRRGPGTVALAGEIARDFSRAVFLTPTQTYADLVGKGIFLPLIVEFSPGPFSQKHKEVKLVREFS